MSDVNAPSSGSFSSLPRTVKERYQAQIVSWTQTLDLANEQLAALLSGSPVEEYEFRSGDGSQKVKRRTVTELMQTINTAEARIRFFETKLYGGGIVSLRLRRKG